MELYPPEAARPLPARPPPGGNQKQRTGLPRPFLRDDTAAARPAAPPQPHYKARAVTIIFPTKMKKRDGNAFPRRKVRHYRPCHIHVLLRDIHVSLSGLATQ